jgi:hypothetical protein
LKRFLFKEYDQKKEAGKEDINEATEIGFVEG